MAFSKSLALVTKYYLARMLGKQAILTKVIFCLNYGKLINFFIHHIKKCTEFLIKIMFDIMKKEVVK